MTDGTVPAVEVQLFTAISLAIALTGGAYSMVIAIKDECKELVDQARDNADDFFEFIKGVNLKTDENYQKGEIAHKQILKWSSPWKWFLRVPTISFCVFVLCLAVRVLFISNPTNLQCKWWIFQWSIGVLLVLDTSSLCLAYFCAYRKVKSSYQDLQSRYKTAKDFQTTQKLTARNLPANQSRNKEGLGHEKAT